MVNAPYDCPELCTDEEYDKLYNEYDTNPDDFPVNQRPVLAEYNRLPKNTGMANMEQMENTRSGDDMWDVPVVVFCVWTVVLVVASLIVLSCLKRETKKFHKRLVKGAARRDEAVTELATLDDIMARYIRHFLNQGVLAKVTSTFANPDGDEEATSIRAEAVRWFQLRMSELRELNYNDKIIKRTILASLKSGLVSHPMDLRGGRRAMEAAKIFLTMDMKKHKNSFLGTQISKVSTPEPPDSCSCPTSACDWVALKFLQLLNLCMAHPNTIPLIFAFISFVVWFYDALTDLVIIDLYWNFVLPTVNPIELPFNSTSLSYQTLTIDLYAPLLLLILLFSLMFTLLSCSCSRLSDRYHIATAYSRPEKEQTGRHHQDATTLIGRYDFNINQASTASLLQFALQFSSYILIIYMLEALKITRESKSSKEEIQGKLDEFGFSSLWFSGFGSLMSLVVAQYNGYKIQHEHCMTLSQRFVYFLACIFNTISIMTVILSFTIVLLMPVSMYVGRYHIMIIVIFIVCMLSIGFIISITLAAFGMDPLSIKADRVIAKFKTNNLLTAYIRFSQTGEKQWATLLGATTLLGRILSLITINLFLPPSQLLVHPFHKFYATSPRSPALHYTIAKQLVYYNAIMILSSLLLCIDIGYFDFNYSLTGATKTLLIYANVTGVPCLFIAYLILFKFYTKYDLWTSNGVHLVFDQQEPIIIDDTFNEYDVENGDETRLTFVKNANNPFLHENSGDESNNQTNDETVETLEVINDTNMQDPVAESTVISNGDADDHNESTEADRMHLMKKTSKIIIRKTTKKINRRIKKSCLCDCVVDVAEVYTKGKWLDISD